MHTYGRALVMRMFLSPGTGRGTAGKMARRHVRRWREDMAEKEQANLSWQETTHAWVRRTWVWRAIWTYGGSGSLPSCVPFSVDEACREAI